MIKSSAIGSKSSLWKLLAGHVKRPSFKFWRLQLLSKQEHMWVIQARSAEDDEKPCLGFQSTFCNKIWFGLKSRGREKWDEMVLEDGVPSLCVHLGRGLKFYLNPKRAYRIVSCRRASGCKHHQSNCLGPTPRPQAWYCSSRPLAFFEGRRSRMKSNLDV